MAYFQQGDVLITKIKKLPAKAKRRESRVLAEGEGTHVHAIAETAEDVKLFEHDGVLYLSTDVDTDIEHRAIGGGAGEHGTITVPPGTYKVDQVKEYDHFAEEARRVID